MTTRGAAVTAIERRGQLLQQLLEMTPENVEAVDLEAVRDLLERRASLLSQLPPPAAADSGEKQLVEEILRRDEIMILELNRRRYKVLSLLHKAGANGRDAPRLVSVRR